MEKSNGSINKTPKQSNYFGVDKIRTAFNFAFAAHDGQTRKLSNLPYVVHPIECGLIAMSLVEHYDIRDEDKYDIICAAILHDTVEDTDATLDDIETIFGTNVRNLVGADTEDKMESLPPSESWRARKEASLEHLSKNADRNGKILWMCDKLSNMRSMFNSYIVMGDQLFEYFHQKDKNEQKWYYDTIEEHLRELNDTGLYQEYVLLKNYIFSDDKEGHDG